MPQDVYHSTGETRYIAFFDFDETYFPHACTEEQLMMVHELEEYLQWLASEQHVKIGWVTGSSLTQVEEKMKKARMRYLPTSSQATSGRKCGKCMQANATVPFRNGRRGLPGQASPMESYRRSWMT
ncbi:hypothetical protein ACPJHQ_04385 [Rossellomorea sp. H39__3]